MRMFVHLIDEEKSTHIQSFHFSIRYLSRALSLKPMDFNGTVPRACKIATKTEPFGPFCSPNRLCEWVFSLSIYLSRRHQNHDIACIWIQWLSLLQLLQFIVAVKGFGLWSHQWSLVCQLYSTYVNERNTDFVRALAFQIKS